MRPRIESALRIAVALAAAATIGACAKKDNPIDTTQTAAGAVVDTTTRAVTVTDVSLGKHIGADKKVTDATDDFAPKDSIYASVRTAGGRAAKLTARWTFQDGQVVDERSENLSAANDTYTEFHIAKPGGWPKGKYTLHVLIDGTEARTKDFTVK